MTQQSKRDELAIKLYPKEGGTHTALRTAFKSGYDAGAEAKEKQIFDLLRACRNKDGSYIGAARARDANLWADWLVEQRGKG